MSASAESVAAGLSAAMKAYVCGEARTIGNPPVWFRYGAEAVSPRTARTLAALTQRGLFERTRFGPTCFTELGTAVRAHLLAQEKGR